MDIPQLGRRGSIRHKRVCREFCQGLSGGTRGSVPHPGARWTVWKSKPCKSQMSTQSAPRHTHTHTTRVYVFFFFSHTHTPLSFGHKPLPLCANVEACDIQESGKILLHLTPALFVPSARFLKNRWFGQATSVKGTSAGLRLLQALRGQRNGIHHREGRRAS